MSADVVVWGFIRGVESFKLLFNLVLTIRCVVFHVLCHHSLFQFRVPTEIDIGDCVYIYDNSSVYSCMYFGALFG